MPMAIEAFDLSAYDVVLSSSHCVAKGVIRVLMRCVAYVHTPMALCPGTCGRSISPATGPMSRYVVPLVLNYLRMWDTASAQRVDHFLTNSQFVARRIAKYYRRRATVVPPPVDTAFFTPGSERGDYYLMVTALVPYKGIDLAIQAFNALRRPLKIIGSGPLAAQLKAPAGPSVDFSAGVRMRNCVSTMRRVGP